MKLTLIAKHLALAGVLTSLSLSAFAEVQPQDATATTRQANNALYKNYRLPIKPTLRTPIKVLSPRCHKT